jgi:hypothetical protein
VARRCGQPHASEAGAGASRTLAGREQAGRRRCVELTLRAVSCAWLHRVVAAAGEVGLGGRGGAEQLAWGAAVVEVGVGGVS